MNAKNNPATPKTVTIIARTGILLALTVVFQYVGRFIPLGLTAILLSDRWLMRPCLFRQLRRIWGLVFRLPRRYLRPTTTTPVAPFLLCISPFIAAGNFILVLIFYLLRKKTHGYNSRGAVLKFVVLFGGLHIMLNFREVPAICKTC